MVNQKEGIERCFGYCRQCDRIHSLESLFASRHARELIVQLDNFGHIDFLEPSNGSQPCYATEALFGKARGKMFGVLLCRDVFGKEIVLYAFSGQFNGRWRVPGWVDPLFDVDCFHRCNDVKEKEIKALGREMETLQPGSKEHDGLRRRRKALSQSLMREIFALYRLPNFRGEERSLYELFTGNGGVPTGTGDCCAPKLLAHAARNNLVPLSLTEFYYGRENLSRSCMHKQFYPPCTTRCLPILGHMLCGVEDV